MIRRQRIIVHTREPWLHPLGAVPAQGDDGVVSKSAHENAGRRASCVSSSDSAPHRSGLFHCSICWSSPWSLELAPHGCSPSKPGAGTGIPRSKTLKSESGRQLLLKHSIVDVTHLRGVNRVNYVLADIGRLISNPFKQFGNDDQVNVRGNHVHDRIQPGLLRERHRSHGGRQGVPSR